MHLFLHYENISAYLESYISTLLHLKWQLTHKQIHLRHLLELGCVYLKKKEKKEREKEKKNGKVTGNIYQQPLFFKAIHVFTPALGQAANVTVYAWSNKNGALHQGNHVGQSLAHSQTFKSWNNKRNPPRTDNQTLSHSEHCEDKCSMEHSAAEFRSPVSTSVTKHSSKRNRVSK